MTGSNGSNAGFRPQELTRRQFQLTTAITLDRQADAILRLQQKVKALGEFVADQSVRIDQLVQQLAEKATS
jgi:hypothetical protein